MFPPLDKDLGAKPGWSKQNRSIQQGETLPDRPVALIFCVFSHDHCAIFIVPFLSEKVSLVYETFNNDGYHTGVCNLVRQDWVKFI